MANINAVLSKMRKAGKLQNMKDKGDAGEDAVLAVCYARRQKTGTGLLYQSYKYPYQTNREGVCYVGNIIYKDNDLIDYSKDTLEDEIDILYITPYRVFPIEVKSYHAKLEVYEHWMNKNGEPVEKSPILQAEKHARHLYHLIAEVLPDGDPAYVKPIVCFVDRCKVLDDRSEHFKEYVPVCVLNNLMKTLNRWNTPLEYNLDLSMISNKLEEAKVSIRKTL